MKRQLTRRTFSREFKLEALRLLEERGMSATSESLGVSSGLLCTWRKKLREEGEAALGAPGGARPHSLEDENKELRRRVRELEEEKEILKKAAAYFAKHTR